MIEAQRAARTAAQSWFLILRTYQQHLIHSATASCSLFQYKHPGQITLGYSWFHWGFFQCVMALTNIFVPSPPHKGATRLLLGALLFAICTTYFVSSNILAWFLLSLLHRSHTTITVILTRSPQLWHFPRYKIRKIRPYSMFGKGHGYLSPQLLQFHCPGKPHSKHREILK